MDPAPPSASTPSPRWEAWRDRLPRPSSPAAMAAGVASLAVVAVLVLTALTRGPGGPAPRLVLPVAGADGSQPPSGADGASAAGTGGGGGSGGTGAAAGAPGPGRNAPPVATVHAAGAVASPGVYSVPAGARVADVVTAAGGPAADAALDRVNLAARVSDGDRIYVPRAGDPASSDLSGPASGPATGMPPGAPLDLNSATLQQLDGLPGVGPATAQAILTHRNRVGRFRSVDELLDVPGIGPSKLEAIRKLVKV